ncbi:lasso peptide biosynthesis B2 protein [Novosphingobium resinovorum]|uniref:Microcin J25-processing protein McjB C-terminal domain-containing protein n=1 Tax=Novosphingobium resinovorum TaxID=158500 RepID=A0A1D8A2W0_9SPHN|nr:lasso peptide biosynthesis B2 protein [Novosphingobium resinovorum]AOR76396.1 hypothetical protein BES08_06250 [Novosphingobium resinovorum]
MGYALRSNLTYCDIDDRLVFLDVEADRYFCLHDSVEARFRALAAGTTDIAPSDVLVRLGLVEEVPGDLYPRPCADHNRPSRSLLDGEPAKPSLRAVLGALTRLALARRALRRGGLARLLHELRKRKARLPSCVARPPSKLEHLAHDFERTARLMRSHDQCLPRAITLAGMAMARGINVELVIGVQLRPFAAHAWVRSGSSLVNERVDTALAYTPILVL